MIFVQNLKSKYPKSFHYFEIFYLEKHFLEIELNLFLELSFTFQLGVFIEFFNSISTDVDIFSNEEEALKVAIDDSFSQYEEYLFLDS